MAHRTTEILEVAKLAVVKFGGEVLETGWTGGCHQYVKFRTPSGKVVKTFLSGSPSKTSAHYQVTRTIRNMMR